MKKLLVFTGISLVLTSCNTINYGGYPIRNSYPARNSGSVANTEREYNELMKTYKPETAEVLTDLLNNDDPSNPRTSISVNNKSSCNMVLTISGNNFFRKIPIGAGKIGYAMVPRNQNYRLSGMLCNSSYQSTKYITSSYNISLSQ
ncbi:DUF6759 domain-containing protein [Chryseobacterium gallinarum]|uniref:Competence protein ComL n=1 Tax=Chryseobacterium gallinarum TaxID=1324352 RepID=A0A0G3M592_CHRGL|nr:DUF6759 domain-containing protein [Chryseobacterium gallinarum]AKK72197.1 competence protein ComL [Chryseobacterium gallinarum]MCL8535770.1 competence protein ComL [Chryseobacterium gallinarum]QIY92090.1 competence protein ComL [Chryseobacterium gallinarum]